jgi:hypothetical protein
MCSAPHRHRLNLQVDSDLSPVNRAVSALPPLPLEALDRRLASVKHHLVGSDRQPLADSAKYHLVLVKRLLADSANPHLADLANLRLEVSANPPPADLDRQAVSARSRRRRQDLTQATPHSHKCVDSNANILFRLSINSLIRSFTNDALLRRHTRPATASHTASTHHNETHASSNRRNTDWTRACPPYNPSKPSARASPLVTRDETVASIQFRKR